MVTPSFLRKQEPRNAHELGTLAEFTPIGFPPRIKYGVTFLRGNDGVAVNL